MNRFTISVAISLALPTVAFAGGLPSAANGWQQVSEGIFERAAPDGSRERIGVGAAGAAQDRQWLTQAVEDLKWKKLFYTLDKESNEALDQAIASYQSALRGVDTAAIQPAVHSSQSGSMCIGMGYEFDSDLTVSSTNATLTGKSTMYPDDFGPPEPPPTSGTFGVTVTINRNLMAPVTHASSGNFTTIPANGAGVRTLGYTINSGSATPQTRPYPFCVSAETFASLSLKGGECGSAGDYRSWYKTYPTCTP